MTETDFNLTVSTCANSIHTSFGGVTSKRELIEGVLRKYFEPLVKRLEQELQRKENGLRKIGFLTSSASSIKQRDEDIQRFLDSVLPKG